MSYQGITMKDRPETERPYEKCLAQGPRSLSDGELLAVFLRCGSRNCSALDLACLLLDKHPVYKGLSGLHHLDYQTLMELPGIGKVKAIEILCLSELARRMARAGLREDCDFSSPEQVASYFMEELRHLEEERVKLVFLNGRHRLIREITLSVGSVNQALVSVRDIFVQALRNGAVSLILLHNHPSGLPDPSRDDILLTQRVKEAGELLEIPLKDHIIIGDQCYTSFMEAGLL